MESHRSSRPHQHQRSGQRSISSPRRSLKTPAYRLLLAIMLSLLFLSNGAGRAQAQEITGDVPDSSAGVFDAAKSAPQKLGSPAGPSSPTGGSGSIVSPSLQNLDLTKRENFSAAMQLIILLTVLSLAPAILIMMTSFTRIVIVLSLLRQAMGTQQLPPNQVLIGLSLFMTFLVMGPTWQKINSESLQPYMDGSISQQTALANAQVPIREFMIRQIIANNNDEDVMMLCQASGKSEPQTWADVGTMTLVPGFMLSELKTAFLMGFKIYLPFLAVDVVISTILISMGMMMLPPVLISLPFKLLLFVLVDGWRLITGSLIGSFGS
jgi:flagellar biosynthetic protein FliP